MARKLSAVVVWSSALTLFVVVGAQSVLAQQSDRALTQFGARSLGAASIEGSERFSLQSTFTEQNYLIDVLRVDRLSVPPAADQELPVVYVLDGNGFFPLVAQSADWLALITEEMPSALVVSIGYVPDTALSRTENLMSRIDLRAHDLTPTEVEFGSPEDETATRVGGGAPEFLAFINENLKPFIAARYHVDPQDQTLIGHSLGGLFAVYTLLNAPDSFNRYVASSPSLWWDERIAFKMESAFVESGQNISARLHLSVGSLESESMVSDVAALVARLNDRIADQAYSELRLTSHVFEGEHHTSVIPAALMRGMRGVFE